MNIYFLIFSSFYPPNVIIVVDYFIFHFSNNNIYLCFIYYILVCLILNVYNFIRFFTCELEFFKLFFGKFLELD